MGAHNPPTGMSFTQRDIGDDHSSLMLMSGGGGGNQ
jgi:hypothetical protein